MLEAARVRQAAVDVYLKMNSGMNRLGFTPDRYRAAHASAARACRASARSR